MKKSILMCLAVLIAAGSTASAANIDVQVKLRRVSVSISDAEDVNIPTIQLLNSDKTKMLYTGDGRSENKEYKFDSFSFPSDAESGDYVLRVGGGGSISETVIKYTAYEEAIEALKTIADDKGTVLKQLSAYPELFGTNAEELASLGSDWKRRIENDICQIKIKYANENEATETIDKIFAVVKKISNWASLIDSADEGKRKEAINAVSGLDKEYLDKLSNTSGIYTAFAAQSIDRLGIDENGILSAFDGAMLAAVINECDWGTGKAALNYYVNKGLINVDSKYLTSGADVYKALKNKKVYDYK